MNNDVRRGLLAQARTGGDPHYDPRTGLCLISRDTLWYATGLLFDPESPRQELGSRLIASVTSEDGTHTPASMIALLRSIPSMLTESVRQHLLSEVRRELVHAADTEWKDGNVNHPLGAYCTLVCGGEMAGEAWAVELGRRRLEKFRRRIGAHRGRRLRQAEMSEYHSLTYTSLSLAFLALIAEYARDDAARRCALALEQGLWVDVAMHFHAPSQQFAGPHSRSYHEDSVGGYSVLHGAWRAAGLGEIYANPELSIRFRHPSDLIQNALTAIVPFHPDERARKIAWKKPMPYGFRKTTYGESYHENSRRAVPAGTPPTRENRAAQPFAFDGEIYPGGWTDLTTYMTGEYALGSAARPYVNAGHSDAVMLRYRRAESIGGMDDFRSMWTRGVYNGSLPGERNFCHTASTEIDESYLTEEGRTLTYQHENRLIACYTPKRNGHRGVRSFRTDIIFSCYAPFDEIRMDGQNVSEFPVRAPAGARICIRDFRTYLLITTFVPCPSSGAHPVEIRRAGDFLIVSICNYDGEERDFTREEIGGWRSGFVLEVRDAKEFAGWTAFIAHAAETKTSEGADPRGIRRIRYESGGHVMVFTCNPHREEIVSREWNGVEERIEHLHVSAAGADEGPFCPASLFGPEALP